jgi:hypothetical protein
VGCGGPAAGPRAAVEPRKSMCIQKHKDDFWRLLRRRRVSARAAKPAAGQGRSGRCLGTVPPSPPSSLSCFRAWRSEFKMAGESLEPRASVARLEKNHAGRLKETPPHSSDRTKTPRRHREGKPPAASRDATTPPHAVAALRATQQHLTHAVVPSPNVSRANCLASALRFASAAASSSSFACCSIRFFCRSSSLTRFASASNNSFGGTGRNFW